jgi:TolB-like protein
MHRPTAEPDPTAAEQAETIAGTVEVRKPAATTPRMLAGRYEIQGLLGVGGMGSVYRVRDGQLDEVVALKLLRLELVSDSGMLARFRQEVKLARRITHSNVVRTFDLGEQDGALFLTMELIEGMSLAQRLAETGYLPVAEVVRIGIEMCAGVAAAHQAGVLHRDLKPDNVLLGRADAATGQPGRVAITDFGIARAGGETGLARTMGGVVGTPAYMAPEQVQGATPDARADIYALGTVLYEMLTGRRAWPGEDVFAVALARVSQPPPDPRQIRMVSDAMAEVVLRCLQRRPDERFASVEQLLEALQGLRLDVPAQPTLATPRPPLSLPVATARTVAVLPFRNAGMPDDAYLAASLTEEVIDALSVTRGLRVRPFGAVQRCQTMEPREAGRALDVDVVVDGSVRRFGDRLRIAAQAISVLDGFQVWARRVDGGEGDALVLSDQLARALAEALTVDLGTQVRIAPTDPEAVDLYLRGRHMLREGWHLGIDPALALLESALARAPDDATILATCALARARKAFFGLDPGATSLELALATARRAVEVAPHLGEPWVALGTAHLYAGSLPAAAQAFRREELGSLLLEAGRIDAAVAHLEAALALDPDSLAARTALVRALVLQGRWEAAKPLIRHSSGDVLGAMHCSSLSLRFAMWRGDSTAVIEVPEIPPEVPAYIAGFRRVVGAQIESLRTRTVNPVLVSVVEDTIATPGLRLRAARCQFAAEALAWAGQFDRALELVGHAVAAGLLDLTWLDGCPLLAPLRDLPAWPGLRGVVAERAAQVLAALDAE